MRASGKYLVVDPLKETETKTKGGLILGEAQREDIRYRQADVVEVGTDVSCINKGDKIYYDKSAGFNVEIEKLKYKVIKEQDVVIIL